MQGVGPVALTSLVRRQAAESTRLPFVASRQGSSLADASAHRGDSRWSSARSGKPSQQSSTRNCSSR